MTSVIILSIMITVGIILSLDKKHHENAILWWSFVLFNLMVAYL